MWTWISRCVPGLSILLLIALLLVAFGDTTVALAHLSPWSTRPPATKASDNHHSISASPLQLSTAQKLFVAYTVLIHLNAVTFVMRLAWALSRMTFATRAVLRRRPTPKSVNGSHVSSFYDSPILAPKDSGFTDLTAADPAALEDGVHGEVVHAIILPNYSEDMETLQTTLNVLASHPRASTQYEVQ